MIWRWKGNAMEMTWEAVRAFRLHSQHILHPASSILAAAQVCGFQNGPAGNWEMALWQRVKKGSYGDIAQAFFQQQLIQAWSFRGAPWIFPLEDASIYLDALCAKEQEHWIYTKGLLPYEKQLLLSFTEWIALLMKALRILDHEVIVSKKGLDQRLASQMEPWIPKALIPLWRSPSPYGANQLFQEAIVSFLLQPASFQRGIVFGPRKNRQPSFTSFPSTPTKQPYEQACIQLVEHFLHAYGPQNIEGFQHWTGMEKPQATRLWQLAQDVMQEVQVAGKSKWMWKQDMEALPKEAKHKALLLSAHDPYLDILDREVLLEDKERQKQVWCILHNPGVVLANGRIVGIWRQRKHKQSVNITVTLWEAGYEEDIRQWAREAAAFFKQEMVIQFS